MWCHVDALHPTRTHLPSSAQRAREGSSGTLPRNLTPVALASCLPPPPEAWKTCTCQSDAHHIRSRQVAGASYMTDGGLWDARQRARNEKCTCAVCSHTQERRSIAVYCGCGKASVHEVVGAVFVRWLVHQIIWAGTFGTERAHPGHGIQAGNRQLYGVLRKICLVLYT